MDGLKLGNVPISWCMVDKMLHAMDFVRMEAFAAMENVFANQDLQESSVRTEKVSQN